VARDASAGNALTGIGTVHAWRVLSGSGEGRNARNGARAGARSRLAAIGAGLRTRALIHGFPLAVAALNRAGLGPLNAEISSGELRGAGLRAMGEVAARLGLGDAYVVFGHTHRAGPLPGDDASEWVGGRHAAAGTTRSERAGARLVNVGCWTYDSIFLTRKRGESPYWPGTCALIGDSGPPELRRLLLDRDYDELSPARRRLSA
jgi:hypothetical protein